MTLIVDLQKKDWIKYKAKKDFLKNLDNDVKEKDKNNF